MIKLKSAPIYKQYEHLSIHHDWKWQRNAVKKYLIPKIKIKIYNILQSIISVFTMYQAGF